MSKYRGHQRITLNSVPMTCTMKKNPETGQKSGFGGMGIGDTALYLKDDEGNEVGSIIANLGGSVTIRLKGLEKEGNFDDDHFSLSFRDLWDQFVVAVGRSDLKITRKKDV